jgi:hypothetical protein
LQQFAAQQRAQTMGRVARYKKVKSVDPFAKARTWTEDVGDKSNVRRVKKRSKTAQKLKDQKNKKRKHAANKNACDDGGFDLPPDGEDEFDMADLLGSVKRQELKSDDFLRGSNSILDNVTTAKSINSSSGEKLASRVEKVDTRGLKSTSQKPQAQKNAKDTGKNAASATKTSYGIEITAHTPTREIIAACNKPSNQQLGADGTNSKQAKRKAFFEQKKLKKKNQRSQGYDSEDDDYDNPNSKATSVTKQPKSQHTTHALVARSALDDQVERPPIFSALPRGASKKKTAAAKGKNKDDSAKADMIRKEQQALEAMRQRVMAQYAVLRESRRA